MNQIDKFILKARNNGIYVHIVEDINLNLDSKYFLTDGKESRNSYNELNIKGGTYCIIFDNFPITIFITSDIKIKILYKILKSRFKIKL